MILLEKTNFSQIRKAPVYCRTGLQPGFKRKCDPESARTVRTSRVKICYQQDRSIIDDARTPGFRVKELATRVYSDYGSRIFPLLLAQRQCAKFACFSKRCFSKAYNARNRQREAILRLYKLHVCFLQVGVK